MEHRRLWCAFARHNWRGIAITALLAVSMGVLRAQDPFEIHVLEYEQLKRGEFTFENHANYVGQGATRDTGGALHLTYELTTGITESFSFGVMQLNDRQPGGPLESAGWRLVPHFYIPQSWHWPVDIGLVTEFTFQNTKLAPDSRSVEILPIIEKRFRKVQLDLNPSFGRALHGPDVDHGWNFGFAARAGLQTARKFTPSIEYYSDWGPLAAFVRLREQTHQILPGGDFRISKNVLWSIGVGVGLTPATERVVYKSRLEISFGGRTKR